MRMLLKNPGGIFLQIQTVFYLFIHFMMMMMMIMIMIIFIYLIFFSRSIRLSILQHVKWTTVDKLSVIPDISLETLKVGNTSRLLSRK